MGKHTDASNEAWQELIADGYQPTNAEFREHGERYNAAVELDIAEMKEEDAARWKTATTDELLRACAGWLSQMLNMICTTSLPAEHPAGSYYPRIQYIPPTKTGSNRINDIVSGWKASDMRRFTGEFMIQAEEADDG